MRIAITSVLCLAGCCDRARRARLGSPRHAHRHRRSGRGHRRSLRLDDRGRLNLVMTIVGGHSRTGCATRSTSTAPGVSAKPAAASTSPATSTPRRRSTAARATIAPAAPPATKPGLVSRRGYLRVFAGLRDDPFFNNVRGTRAALNVAAAALPTRRARCRRLPALRCGDLGEDPRRVAPHRGSRGHEPAGGLEDRALVVIHRSGRRSRAAERSSACGPRPRGSRHPPSTGAPSTAWAARSPATRSSKPFGSEDAANRRKEEYNRAPRAGWPVVRCRISR